MELSAHVATAITMQYTCIYVTCYRMSIFIVFMKIVYIIN